MTITALFYAFITMVREALGMAPLIAEDALQAAVAIRRRQQARQLAAQHGFWRGWRIRLAAAARRNPGTELILREYPLLLDHPDFKDLSPSRAAGWKTALGLMTAATLPYVTAASTPGGHPRVVALLTAIVLAVVWIQHRRLTAPRTAAALAVLSAHPAVI